MPQNLNKIHLPPIGPQRLLSSSAAARGEHRRLYTAHPGPFHGTAVKTESVYFIVSWGISRGGGGGGGWEATAFVVLFVFRSACRVHCTLETTSAIKGRESSSIASSARSFNSLLTVIVFFFFLQSSVARRLSHSKAILLSNTLLQYISDVF